MKEVDKNEATKNDEKLDLKQKKIVSFIILLKTF